MPSNRLAHTVTGLIRHQAKTRGDAPAIHFDGLTVSFAALETESRRAAAGLARHGIGEGDRVALWLPNAPAWLVLYLACAQLGAVAIAVNTRFRAVELNDILSRSGARALAYWPGFRGIDFDAILQDVAPDIRAQFGLVIGLGDTAGGGTVVPYEAFVAEAPLAGTRAAADAGTIVFTTSGTTRAARFVLHSQFSIAEHARLVARDFGYDAADAVMLQALPLFGVFGFSQAMASLAAGRPMVLMPGFAAEEAAGNVRSFSVTHMNGTDDMYRAMLAARSESRPFPSLRMAGFAAFNSDPAELEREAAPRGVPLVGLYGMSEVQALYARQRLDAGTAERIRAGGYPVAPGAAVRARDPESGRVLGNNAPGELEMRGPSLMTGYLGDDDATARALTDDGFVRTGDLGYVREDGGFVFLTRMGDAMRLGGFLVAPAEIEAVVQDHPDIRMCQVVAVAHEGRSSAVAFVTLAEGAGLDEAALRRYCADGLAKFKVPERIVALDAFPATDSPNGRKIQRARLRSMAMALLDGANGAGINHSLTKC